MKLTVMILALFCAHAAFAKPGCTTQQVQGTYGLLANGFVLVPGSPISGPFMRIGTFSADGKGGAVISTLAIYNGINFGPEFFSGTYSVTSDCTIDLHL